MSAPATTAPAVEESYELGPEWRPTVGLWARFRSRVRGNVELGVGSAMLIAFGVVALAAVAHFGDGLDVLRQHNVWIRSLDPMGPSRSHPFGVMTGLGVDILESLFQATPIDLALLGGSILLTVGAGLLVGAYAGLVGGPVDFVVTVTSDLLSTVPPFFFVMVLFLGLQPFVGAPSFLWIFALLYAVVLWPYHARPVRAAAQRVASEPYVEAARAAGGGTGRILQRHVIPNSIYPLLAQIPVDVYNFLFVLTVFPFLSCFGGGSGGFFAPLSPLPTPSYPEWGYLLASGACYGWSPLTELNHWWMYAFPAMVVILFGVAVALACDGAERLLAGARATR